MQKKVFCFLCAIFLFYSKRALSAREQLVQIAVEIVELDVSKSYRFGIKWIDTISAQESSIPGIFSVGDFARLDKLSAELKLLMEKGAAELLANPKLVTKNGSLATFQAGGEIPYIVSAGYGTVHVEFKPYGVILEIKPVIEPEGIILLNLKAEISSPDETTAVSLSGNTVPGLISRKLVSQLSIKSGTTITIAGLNQTRKERFKSGIPLLSEIPLLGALFSHDKTVERKTSVVIFVTPTILEEK